MRYISPIARVRMGDDEFLSGDRLLRFVSVTQGEDARSSNCRFEVFDPELKIADKYFKISFDQGGIEVPADLLDDKKKASSGGSGSASAGSGNDSASSDVSQTPEVRAWLDTIAWCEGTSGANGYNIMFTGATFEGYGDHPRQIKGSNGLYSDAAGRYQFLSTTWDGLGLKEFTPENQDKGAVLLLKSRGALAEVQQGEAGVAAVCEKISYEWASIPPYRYPGQGSKTLAQIQAYYKEKLAKYKGQGTPSQQAATQQPAIQDKANSKPREVSNKGTEVVIELGYQLDQLIAFHYIHIGTQTQGRQLDSTTFQGQTVRWLMTRRTKNTSHGNITLRQLGERVAKAYGLTLEMEGDGPTYQHIDQTGITDYELLLREARAIGYAVRDEGQKLILKPWRPDFTGFVITADILVSIQFADHASKDRSPSPSSTTTTPATPAADPKAKIDRLTGQVTQTKLEDSTGTGKADQNASGTTGAIATTGAPAQPVQGTPAPSSAAKTAGAPNLEVYGPPAPAAPAAAIAAKPNIDSKTGLPRQEIGAIDLQDGRAEAETIKDESKRIKGYESRATILTTPEALMLAPGSIIGISRNCVPETFAREWRVGSVTHTLQNGQMRTSLEFYSPQAVKGKSGSASTSSATLESSQSASGWASPMVVEGNSSCGPKCEYGYARGRLHEGLDFGGYGVGSDPDGVFAASNGIVTNASALGGYGQTVDIKRSDEWSSRYAHLAKIDVAVGQEVKQGQRIGTRGNTGGDYAIHLHFEIRRPDGNSTDPREFLPKPQIPMAG